MTTLPRVGDRVQTNPRFRQRFWPLANPTFRAWVTGTVSAIIDDERVVVLWDGMSVTRAIHFTYLDPFEEDRSLWLEVVHE